MRELLRDVDDLHAAIAPEYFRSAPRSESEWVRLLDEDSGVVFVAEPVEPVEAQGAVGMLSARIYDTPDNPAMVQRRRVHVETVVVSGEQRRRGIGRRLMAEGAAWGRSHGAVEVVLTTWIGNDEAEAFYARLGYQVLSRVLCAPLT